MFLSEELQARIKAELPKYPEKRAVLLTALHFVQAEHGWIPPESVPEVAQILELHPIDVKEVVSFYSLFHEEPVGRCHIQVCTNLSCALANARGVVRAFEDALGIRVGEVTDDGNFSLYELECLGSCGTAPVVQVNNERFLEGVKPDDVKGVLGDLEKRIREKPDSLPRVAAGSKIGKAGGH